MTLNYKDKTYINVYDESSNYGQHGNLLRLEL